MRIPVIAGNWKLNKKRDEALKLVQELAALTSDAKNTEIIVAPCFTVLECVCSALAGTRISVAGQNCFWEESGAFTGEVSPAMLMDAGCSHVIIGHSERRQHFGETDVTVNKKINAALQTGLTVILCVGETLEERESKETFTIIEKQIRSGLQNISSSAASKLLVAYEPVWAIGTGRTARDEQAQEVHAFIRNLLADIYSTDFADTVRILYGGSVKPENISGLMSQPDIDGALVGGASLTSESFSAIVNFGK